MKRILFSILLIFTIGVVNAQENTLDFYKEIDVEVLEIADIVGYKDGYILSEELDSNTNLYSYNNEMKLQVTKKLENLSKIKMINYEDYFLIVGVTSNRLKVYFIDGNLQVLNQKETSYFIPNDSEINLYSYENKVYILLTYDDNLISTNIYEINSDLEITENKFSSYNADNLKNIFKSDYYVVHNNDKEINGRIIHYNSSTYLNENNVLIGYTSSVYYNELTGFDEKAIITYFDNYGEKINEIAFENYLDFKDALVVNDKIVALGKNKLEENVLIIFDINGNILEEIKLDIVSDNPKIEKVSNNIVVLDENKIISYVFLVNIYKEEDIFGFVEVNELANPYDLVKINVIPNSGYNVKEINVRDSQGNIINVLDGEFVMPTNDVFISVNYEESVENPETIDFIAISVFVLIIGVILFYHLYKKLIWLK